MEYDEDEFLNLADLQHFSFCRRQWALIHIEQQWNENLRTAEGHILHENAHDSLYIEQHIVTFCCRSPHRERGLKHFQRG